jgi:hypothetical protein
MKLECKDGFAFELSIVGYEFPGLVNAEYDSNWLNVRIVARHPRGDWSAVDPALETHDVRKLAEWFRALESGRRDELEMGFIEACLSFKAQFKRERPSLEVELAHEFRPAWAEDIDQSAVLSFPLDEIDLSSAAESLEQQLAKYPPRAER